MFHVSSKLCFYCANLSEMQDIYDVIIIGGGVTGCACAFELSSYGYSCLLLEKNDSLVGEASSGNRLERRTELFCTMYFFSLFLEVGHYISAWSRLFAKFLSLIIRHYTFRMRLHYNTLHYTFTLYEHTCNIIHVRK